MSRGGWLVLRAIVVCLGAIFVAGPAAALAQAPDRCTKSVCVDRKQFYDGFRRFSRTHELRQDPKRLSPQAFEALQGILNRWDTTADFKDTRWLAYVLATVFWETGGNLYPVREGLCDNPKCTIDYLERLWRLRLVRQRYWDPDATTGQSYYGRGQVQLTHLVNYWRVGIELSRTQTGDRFADLDRRLVNQPDLALKEWVSTAALMEGMVRGWYNVDYGKGLSSYINEESPNDRVAYLEARRTVNGLDKRDLLADFALDIHRFIEIVPASADHKASAALATEEVRDVPAKSVQGGDGKVRGRSAEDVDTAYSVGPEREDDDAYVPRDIPIDFSNPVGPIRNVTGMVAGGAAAAANRNLKQMTDKERAKVQKKRKKKRKKARKKRQREKRKNNRK